MKTNFFINLSRNYLLVMLLTLCCCAPTTKDICGVFLITDEYERTGNLDFLVVKEDFTYMHYYIQGDDVKRSGGSWRKCQDSDIEFNDWIYYGLSDEWFRSFIHNHDYQSSTIRIKRTTYHNNKYLNIADETLDYYRLSDEEIAKYKIDSMINTE